MKKPIGKICDWMGKFYAVGALRQRDQKLRKYAAAVVFLGGAGFGFLAKAEMSQLTSDQIQFQPVSPVILAPGNMNARGTSCG